MSEDNGVVERVQRDVDEAGSDLITPVYVADLRSLLALARQSSGVGEEEMREVLEQLHGDIRGAVEYYTANTAVESADWERGNEMLRVLDKAAALLERLTGQPQPQGEDE